MTFNPVFDRIFNTISGEVEVGDIVTLTPNQNIIRWCEGETIYGVVTSITKKSEFTRLIDGEILEEQYDVVTVQLEPDLNPVEPVMPAPSNPVFTPKFPLDNFFTDVPDLFLRNKSTQDIVVLPGEGLRYLNPFIVKTQGKDIKEWKAHKGNLVFLSVKQSYFFKIRAAEALGNLKGIDGITLKESKALSSKTDSKGNHYINHIEFIATVSSYMVVSVSVRDRLEVTFTPELGWEVIDPDKDL